MESSFRRGNYKTGFSFLVECWITVSTIDLWIFLEYEKNELLSKPNILFECAVMCMNINLSTKNLDFTLFQTIN